MRATVQQGEYKAERSSDEELQRLVNQQRKAINVRLQDGPHLLTTRATGVATTIWLSDDMPGDVAWEADAYVLGVSSDMLQAARYSLSALFSRASSGGAAQVGATTTVVSIETVAGFNAAFGVSGNGVTLTVQDDGAATMSWSALVYVREVS